MEIQKTQWFAVLQNGEIALTETSVLHTTIDQLLADYSSGDGLLVIPKASLPADFSVDTYTIENGELVRASAEIIAEREAAARVASREAIRTERERRYEAEPIKSLYWNWIESGQESDRTLWIAAKNAVRAELPYPEEPTAV